MSSYCTRRLSPVMWITCLGQFPCPCLLVNYQIRQDSTHCVVIMRQCYLYSCNTHCQPCTSPFFPSLSPSLSPPQGYLFVSVLIGETHDLLQLIIQAIRHDLESRNPVFNTLAMQCVANIATQDMAEQLGKDVAPLLVSPYVGGSGWGGGLDG